MTVAGEGAAGCARRQHWRRTLLTGMASGLVSFALAGCGNMVGNSGVYYNAGLAQSSNDVLLANVVRSAKGYPIYYSALGDYSGSTSVGTSADVSSDIIFATPDANSMHAGVTPTVSANRNANVSSLETQQFVQGMHTRISPQLFTFLAGSRQGANLNLKIALLVESFTITAAEVDRIVSGAQDVCRGRSASLPRVHRGVCATFQDTLAQASCAGDPKGGNSGAQLVSFRNDPSNPCEYARFRLFTEAFMLNEPRLIPDKDGNTVVSVGFGASRTRLFGPKGTGFVLRSPNEVVGYLGEIVRERYRSGVQTKLTTAEGQSVPIILVERGLDGGRASVSVEVDSEKYWLPRQDLSRPQRDFSHHALAVVKDFQALNTSHSQLPSSPTIILGGASRI